MEQAKSVADAIFDEKLISGRPITSAERFFACSGDRPWIPFSYKNDPIANEERALFGELDQRYNRHVSPSDPQHGYNSFRDEWNRLAGERYYQSLIGREGDEVVVIFRKSTKQLQDHFDKVDAEMRQSALLSRVGEQRRQDFCVTFCAGERYIPAPLVGQVQLQTYPTAGTAKIPPGDPLNLNAEIGAANLKQRASQFGRDPYKLGSKKRKYDVQYTMSEMWWHEARTSLQEL
jgi:hypothetical protein